MRTAAYIRVSTQEQKMHGLSLDAQKDKLQEYADKHNLNIVGWYIDAGVSGRKLIKNRPALQQMINEKDKYDHIIFIKLDRFFRSVAEYHECMKLLNKTWTATEEEYDLTTANGRMLVNMKLTIAELEADQTGERIKLVNEYKIKEGKPICRMPFYFKTVPDGRGKRIELDNHEMLIDAINHFKTFQSLTGTAFYINDKYGSHYEAQYIKQIFKDKRLYGEYRGNPTYCPAHITKDEFEELQRILPNQLKYNCKHNYLFRGLLRCPECGSKMSGNMVTDGSRKIPTYMCGKHKHTHTCSHNHSYIESIIEKQLLEIIEPLFAEHKKFVVKSLENKIDPKPIEEELNRLNYSWQKGRLSVEEYDRKYDEITKRLNNACLTQHQRTQDELNRIDQTLKSGWRNVYAALDAEHKQAFWRSFIKEIHLVWKDTRPHTAVSNVLFY